VGGMSVTTVVTALQAVHAAISGIKKAPVAWPAQLNTAQLPIVLVRPGAATWNMHAVDGLKRRERVYEAYCFVAPVAQDKAGPENPITLCNTLLELFGLAYLDDVTLGGVVEYMPALADTGVLSGGDELTWGGAAYWGFVYRVTVVEKA